MDAPPSRTKLFVGHLPSGCTSEDLLALFSDYGSVTECDAINKYGFVHFRREEEADRAIRCLNNYNLMGSQISVEPARSQLHRQPGDPGRAQGVVNTNPNNRRPRTVVQGAVHVSNNRPREVAQGLANVSNNRTRETVQGAANDPSNRIREVAQGLTSDLNNRSRDVTFRNGFPPQNPHVNQSFGEFNLFSSSHDSRFMSNSFRQNWIQPQSQSFEPSPTVSANNLQSHAHIAPAVGCNVFSMTALASQPSFTAGSMYPRHPGVSTASVYAPYSSSGTNPAAFSSQNQQWCEDAGTSSISNQQATQPFY